MFFFWERIKRERVEPIEKCYRNIISNPNPGISINLEKEKKKEKKRKEESIYIITARCSKKKIEDFFLCGKENKREKKKVKKEWKK